MSRQAATITFLVVLLLLRSPVAGAQAPATVEWEAGRLSVRAEKTPLHHLLQEVARRTGLRLRGTEALRQEVWVGFSGLPLRQALQRLLAGVSHVLIEEPAPDGATRSTLAVLGGRERAGRQPAGMTPAEDARLLDDEPSGQKMEAALTDADPATRRWAVEWLPQIGDQWAFHHLLEALNDDDAGVREAALGGLGQYGLAALDPTLMLLQREASPEVRVAALGVLGQVGGEKVAGILRDMLRDPDPRIRTAAVEAMASAGGPLAAETLKAAAADQDADVRTAALAALGIHGDPERALQEALVDGDEEAQAVAAELAGTLGPGAGRPGTPARSR